MPNRDRPNIVLLFTDDQRFDTIGALGYDEVATPNIDRLVARGTAFTNAYIMGGSCGAVCMPSRAMLHTGRTLFHLAEAGQYIPEEHVLLGEWLQQQGYRTCGVGKWHNGPRSYARSFTEGAEIFFGGMADHWNVPACYFDPSGRYPEATPWIWDPRGGNAVAPQHVDHVTFGKHSTELFGEATAGFLRGYDSDAPFFAYVAFMAPHDPRSMPKRFLDMYDPNEIELPANLMPEHPFDNGALRIRDEMLAAFPRTPEETRRHIAEYYAMISHLDHQVGEVLRALEETGRADDTIIIFAGDNGLALGQHGLMGKQNNYEHSVRVPLIMCGPGIPRDVRSDALVYLLDIYPTLCDLLGAPAPATVEGRSLVPAMHDPQEKVRDALYFAYSGLMRSVRDQRFKLIEYIARGERHTQLFDLQNDPIEMHNLASEPAYAARLAELRRELFRYRDAWGDLDTTWGQTFWSRYSA